MDKKREQKNRIDELKQQITKWTTSESTITECIEEDGPAKCEVITAQAALVNGKWIPKSVMALDEDGLLYVAKWWIKKYGEK